MPASSTSSSSSSSSSANSLSHTLISAAQNIHMDAFRLESAEAAPSCPTPWSVRMSRLRGGRQEGVDLLVISAGDLTMRLTPTRGMGILDVTCGDVHLGWDSPVKEVVHPAFINLGARGGTGWLEGFCEYMVRCGLEWFGPPGSDAHHLAHSEPPADPLTLHGKIANIPASEVSIEIETVAPWRVRVHGLVREAMQYGPKFELATTVTITPGEAGFTVADEVTNVGGQTQEFGVLYHINHGPPLLEEGSRFVGPVKSVTPRDEESKRGLSGYDHYGPPVKGALEQAFFLELHGTKSGGGDTRVMLHNKPADRGVALGWSLEALPCLTIWKGLHAKEDGYVTGLEPATGYPNPRPAEREAGRVPTLEPGQTRRMAIDYVILRDAAAVKRVHDEINTMG